MPSPFKVVQQRLIEADVVLRLQRQDGPFWHQKAGDNDATEENIIDATFVDDEALVLIAQSPTVSVRAINVLLSILTFTTFNEFRL